MAFCLHSSIVKTFLEKLKSGEIDPQKLADMPSSLERRNVFAEFMGEENAIKTNALFESKLLLKNTQLGLINWAKEVAGLKGKAQRDFVSRIEKLDEKILSPENEQSFYADLAAQKLGTTVTMAEAAEISKMAADVSKKRAAINNGGDRLDYGLALVDFGDYVGKLKEEAGKTTLQEIKNSPLQAAEKAVSDVSGFVKALATTGDVSMIGRQGWKVMFNNPVIWLKNSLKSFSDIAKTLGGQDALRLTKAEVLSRPNALNGKYKKQGLAIGNVEEAIPTSAPEKIPGIGRLFRASNEAFTAWQYRVRADVFDKLDAIASRTPEMDTNGLGQFVNTLTGRGTLKKFEKAAGALNNILFSPRNMRSNWDTLTFYQLNKDKMSPFARRQAYLSSLRIISGIAATLAIAKAVNPSSVENDWTSADAGKIKEKNTRFDVSGGMGGYAILAARLYAGMTGGKIKSSTTGKKSKLNSGKFGSRTVKDVVYDFFENKMAPAASLVKMMAEGENFDGERLDTMQAKLKEAAMLPVPMVVKTFMDVKDEVDRANLLQIMLAEEFGVSTSTYSKKKRR